MSTIRHPNQSISPQKGMSTPKANRSSTKATKLNTRNRIKRENIKTNTIQMMFEIMSRSTQTLALEPMVSTANQRIRAMPNTKMRLKNMAYRKSRLKTAKGDSALTIPLAKA